MTIVGPNCVSWRRSNQEFPSITWMNKSYSSHLKVRYNLCTYKFYPQLSENKLKNSMCLVQGTVIKMYLLVIVDILCIQMSIFI